MSLYDTRLFRLSRKPEDPVDIAEQIQDLRHMLFSLAQDVEVLKGMLAERGVWDTEVYRKLRVERMLDDHSSIGGGSWRTYSYYKFTLDEEEFLRHHLKMDDQAVVEFRDRAAYMETLT